MLTKQATSFEVTCDVCGHSEHFEATSHDAAWTVLKRAAWAVRRNAYPIIHICPECPVEGKKIAPSR